jgi:hypothetical protein
MKVSVFILTIVSVLIIFTTGCLEIKTFDAPKVEPSLPLCSIKGYYQIDDHTTYGVWYLSIDKSQLQKHLPRIASYHIKLKNTSFPLEQNKLNDNLLFALLPEDIDQQAIGKAVITSNITSSRNNGNEEKRALSYIILEKDVAENGTKLFRLSLSDYLQLKGDRTSFIYKNSVLIRPLYVISDEGNSYTFKRYLDARQTGLTKDVDGAFRFLNNLSDPDAYMFFGNPNKVRLKPGGYLEKSPPDTRQRLRTLGSCGDLTTGNLYQIEADTPNNCYRITINLNNMPPEYTGKAFFSAYINGKDEHPFMQSTPSNIIEATVSYDSAKSQQIIKNARILGVMYKLTDTAGRTKGYYTTLSEAAAAASDNDCIIAGTGEAISETRQTHLHDITISILSENKKHFTLDYTNSATRCLLLTGSSTLYLKDALIRHCEIADDGGAILITGENNPVLNIEKSHFDSNVAGNGGAIMNEGGIVTITESTLTANSATGSEAKGNALYNTGKLTFYDNTIVSNTSLKTVEALRIGLSGRVYNSEATEWKRFNAPSADLRFVENRPNAENVYKNQGLSEGSNIRFDEATTNPGTLTLRQLQGEEETLISLTIDYLTGCEFLNGEITLSTPIGFEITDDASVIIDTVVHPAGDYSPQPHAISIDTLTLDKASTVSLILKTQEIPAAYTAGRLITKPYMFKATSDADGSGTAFSHSEDSTTVFTSTGLSRNTDFRIKSGKEMYVKLETGDATALKVCSGITAGEITAQLKSVDGKTQQYTLYDSTGIITENSSVTSPATLTVTPPKGTAWTRDFEVKIHPNPFVRLEKINNPITWHETIQTAIDNGTDGSTITLWEGSYIESIDLGNNNFHIVSTDPSNDAVRNNTIITGSGGSAITINGGQDNRTLIMGLNISGNTNGNGITVGNANPVILENRIANNSTVKGAGLLIQTFGPAGQRTGDLTLIKDNLIENNTADLGGGIYVETGRSPKIIENVLKNNRANNHGGGIYVAEGGTVQNINGGQWKAHQLPGTTTDAKEVEGVANTNIYTLNNIAGNTISDNAQLYYTRTDTAHLTDWVSHDKLNQIILAGNFSTGDIMRVFDANDAVTEIASTTYTSGGKMIINRDVTSSSTYYVSLQDALTSVYAQSTKRQARVINTPASAPGLTSPANGAVNVQRPVTLKWTTGIGEETFNFYFGTDPNSLSLMGNFPRTTLQFTHNSLAANTTYYWKVEGVDRHGATISSPVFSFTTFVFEGGDGSTGNPYQVKTAEQLNTVRNYLSSHFIQTGNISLSGYTSWVPISTFSGTYDGQNYSISNLKINTSGDNTGLFGYASGATLKNINLTGVYIRQNGYGSKDCGALVGNANKTTITNCHSSGMVYSEGDNVGGLVGYYQSNSSVFYITESHSSCSVTGRYDGGGLVGTMLSYVSIRRSYATGNVTTDTGAGGLVGLFDGAEKVEDCYARGNVKATYYQSISGDFNGMVGGLIGRINAGTMVKNSYSTGKVTYNYSGSKGGLIGKNVSPVTNCYWDTQTSGMQSSAGGEGLTTAEMKSSGFFSNWNFSSIWILDAYNNGYPRLRNNFR